MIRKFLIFARVIQVRKFKDSFNLTYQERRLNPFNPLTYVTILITFMVGIVMFGVVGVWKEMDLSNPFKYR